MIYWGYNMIYDVHRNFGGDINDDEPLPGTTKEFLIVKSMNTMDAIILSMSGKNIYECAGDGIPLNFDTKEEAIDYIENVLDGEVGIVIP